MRTDSLEEIRDVMNRLDGHQVIVTINQPRWAGDRWKGETRALEGELRVWGDAFIVGDESSLIGYVLDIDPLNDDGKWALELHRMTPAQLARFVDETIRTIEAMGKRIDGAREEMGRRNSRPKARG